MAPRLTCVPTESRPAPPNWQAHREIWQYDASCVPRLGAADANDCQSEFYGICKALTRAGGDLFRVPFWQKRRAGGRASRDARFSRFWALGLWLDPTQAPMTPMNLTHSAT